MKTTTNAARELTSLLECHRSGIVDLFSHMSQCDRSSKPSVYRRLRERGLIVKSPENDRYPMATVWHLTAKALDVRSGEELSAVS